MALFLLLIDNIQLVNTDWILIGFRSVNIEGQAFLTYQKTTRGFEFKALKSVINSFKLVFSNQEIS